MEAIAAAADVGFFLAIGKSSCEKHSGDKQKRVQECE